jgi:hypothetical protein
MKGGWIENNAKEGVTESEVDKMIEKGRLEC